MVGGVVLGVFVLVGEVWGFGLHNGGSLTASAFPQAGGPGLGGLCTPPAGAGRAGLCTFMHRRGDVGPELMQRRWRATTPVPAPQQAHHSGRDRCRRSAQGAERIEGIEGIAEAPSGSCSARPLHLDPRPAEHFNPAGPPSVAPAPQLAGVGVGNPAGVAGRQIGIAGHQPAAAAVREPARLRAGRRLVPLGRRGGAGGHAPTLTAPAAAPARGPRAAPPPTALTSNPPGSNPPNRPKDGEFRTSSILGVEN